MARDTLPATARAARDALTTLAWMWSLSWAGLGVASFVLLAPEGVVRVGVQGASLWLGAVAVLVLGGKVLRLRLPTVITVALALLPLTLLLKLQSGLRDGWPTAVLAAVLGVGALGLAVRARWSVPLGAALALMLVGARVVAIQSLTVRTGERTFAPRGLSADDTLIPALAVAVTLLLTVAVRRLLVRSVAALEAGRAALTAQRMRLGAALARDDELERQQSLLHDTALNTLGVLGRGGLGQVDPGKVRERCRADAVRLRDWLSGSGGAEPADLVAYVRYRADLLGLSVSFDPHALRAFAGELDGDALGLLARVLDEGLLNVSKHSRRGRARLTLARTTAGATVRIVDDGARSDAPESHAGHGIASLQDAVESVGGRLTLSVGPTRSVLEAVLPTQGTPSTSEHPDGPGDGSARIVGRLATRAYALAVVWSVGGFATLLWTRDSYDAPWLQAASILALGVWSALQWAARVRGRPVGADDVVITAALVVVAQLAAVAADTSCSAAVDHSVPLDAAPLLVLATCLARTTRAVVVSCLSALVGGAALAQLLWSRSWHGCGPSNVLGALAAAILVLLLLYFAQTLRRQMAAASEVEADRALTAEQAVRTEAVAATRREWFEPVVELTLPLLESVADGRRPIDDESLRTDCRRDATFLRALISVPSDDRPVSDVVRRLVLRTRSRGYGLTIRGSVARFAPPVASLPQLETDWDTVITTAHGGTGAILFVDGTSSSLFVPGADVDDTTARALSAPSADAGPQLRRTVEIDDGVLYVSEVVESPSSSPSSLARM